MSLTKLEQFVELVRGMRKAQKHYAGLDPVNDREKKLEALLRMTHEQKVIDDWITLITANPEMLATRVDERMRTYDEINGAHNVLERVLERVKDSYTPELRAVLSTMCWMLKHDYGTKITEDLMGKLRRIDAAMQKGDNGALGQILTELRSKTEQPRGAGAGVASISLDREELASMTDEQLMNRIKAGAPGIPEDFAREVFRQVKQMATEEKPGSDKIILKPIQ